MRKVSIDAGAQGIYSSADGFYPRPKQAEEDRRTGAQKVPLIGVGQDLHATAIAEAWRRAFVTRGINTGEGKPQGSSGRKPIQ